MRLRRLYEAATGTGSSVIDVDGEGTQSMTYGRLWVDENGYVRFLSDEAALHCKGEGVYSGADGYAVVNTPAEDGVARPAR